MTERSTFPTDEEVHEDLMEQLLLGIHVAMPGRIQSYDPVHQVADIVVQLRHRYPDPEGSGAYLEEDYPVLPAVPVLFPRMGKWFMATSVEPGDCVQVLFNSSAIGLWRRSTVVDNVEGLDRALRGVSSVVDVGRHHLSHAVAVLGLETYGNPIRHAPPARAATEPDAALVFGSDLADGTRISIYGDKSVTITQGATAVVQIDPDGTVHVGGAAGDFLALANLVNARLSSIRSTFNGHSHASNDAEPSALMGELASVAATKAMGA